jgi:taurine-pyruvate aminotransferase
MDHVIADRIASDLLEADQRHVWHHLSQHGNSGAGAPPMMVRGEGIYVWDVHGKKYLDGSSGGVWCVNVGYGRASMPRL